MGNSPSDKRMSHVNTVTVKTKGSWDPDALSEGLYVVFDCVAKSCTKPCRVLHLSPSQASINTAVISSLFHVVVYDVCYGNEWD